MPSDSDSLAGLHELPWSEIEGERLLVQREWDDNDLSAPMSEFDPDKIHHEERVGAASRPVGRHGPLLRHQAAGEYPDDHWVESLPLDTRGYGA